MNNDYYEYINFKNIDLIDEVKEYIDYCEKNDKFSISQLGQCRINFTYDIYKKFRQFMSFQISDIGCFKNVPGWIYPVHKDKNRKFAMNMLLSEANEDFETLFYNDDRTESWPIPYIQNQWVLINTKKFHGVKNNSKVNRYVISIGCTVTDYSTILDLYRSNNNIGLNT